MKGAIVLAEDDPINVELLRSLLEQGGYTPMPVRDAESCLRLLSHVQPRAVLLDVNLPGMNGLEALRTIRANQRFDDIPIVMVTSRPDAEVIEKALHFPKVFVIAKPFRPSEFVSRMERCLAIARQENRP
jgi:CheY-like chemotaxis protein